MKATVTVKLQFETGLVLLAASESSDFSNRVLSSPLAPNEFGFVRGEIDGLLSDTEYFIGVENLSGQRAEFVGKLRTPKQGPHSFSFASASCNRSGSNARTFDAIRARAESGEISFFVHTGDIHYDDIVINNEAIFHSSFDNSLSTPRQRLLWSVLPMYYIWDDHDYGENDSGRDSPSRQAALAAFRRRVPSPTLVKTGAEDAVYYSFVKGRVRFVVSDLRSERAEKGQFPTNDPQQVAFTAEQRDWMFAEFLAAQAADQAIIWVSTKPFMSDTGDGLDYWGGYNFARQEILDFIDTNNLNRRIAVLSGDMHALAYDDGSSINNPSNLRIMQAAPLHQNGSSKGGPYLIEPIRDQGVSTYQYGLFDITDNGSGDINMRFRGFRVDNNTGAETEMLDVNFDMGPNL